jgi:hypothetical protein
VSPAHGSTAEVARSRLLHDSDQRLALLRIEVESHGVMLPEIGAVGNRRKIRDVEAGRKPSSCDPVPARA